MDGPKYTDQIAKRYSDLKGELHLVTLSKCGFTNLGMSLVGNKDLSVMNIFVSTVKENYPAAKSGKIFVGDELLEVNGRVLYGRSHLNASPIFNAITTDSISLILLRSADSREKMAISASLIAPQHPSPIQKVPCETIIKRHPTLSLTSFDPSLDLDASPTTPSESMPIYQATSTILTITTTNAASTTSSTTIDSSKSEDLKNRYHTSVTQAIPTTCTVSSISTTPTSPKISFSTSIKPISPKSSPKSSTTSTNSTTLTTEMTLTTIVTVTAETTTVKTPPVGGEKEHELKITEDTSVDKAENDEQRKKHHLKLDLSKTNKPPLPPSINRRPTVTELNGADDSVFPEEQTSDSNNIRVTDILSASIVPGIACLIEIPTDKKALGLKVIGGSNTALTDVFVYEMYEGGMACKDGRLKVGDQLIEINGRPACQRTHEEVMSTLRSLNCNVKLLVLRAAGDDDEFSLYKNLRKRLIEKSKEFNVEMVRRANRPLGLCIRPMWKDRGVVVNNVMGSPGFLLEENSVRRGDEISEVNDVCLYDTPTLEAIFIIKSLYGNVRLKVNRSNVGLIDTSPLSLLSPPTPSPISNAFKHHSSASDKPHEIKRSKSLIRRAIPACLTSVSQ